MCSTVSRCVGRMETTQVGVNSDSRNVYPARKNHNVSPDEENLLKKHMHISVFGKFSVRYVLLIPLIQMGEMTLGRFPGVQNQKRSKHGNFTASFC